MRGCARARHVCQELCHRRCRLRRSGHSLEQMGCEGRLEAAARAGLKQRIGAH